METDEEKKIVVEKKTDTVQTASPALTAHQSTSASAPIINVQMTPFTMLNNIPPVYKKSNYLAWKLQMEAFLNSHKLRHIIMNKYIEIDVGKRMKSNGKFEISVSDIDAKYNNKQEIVDQMNVTYSLLLKSLENEPETLTYVSDCTTGDAQAVWYSVIQLNESKLVKRKIHLKEQLFELKMKPKEIIKNYISRIKQIVGEIRLAGDKIDEDEVKILLLKGLDKKKYGVKKDIIETKLHELSIDDMMDILRDRDDDKMVMEDRKGSADNNSESEDKEVDLNTASANNTHVQTSRGGYRGRGYRGRGGWRGGRGSRATWRGRGGYQSNTIQHTDNTTQRGGYQYRGRGRGRGMKWNRRQWNNRNYNSYNPNVKCYSCGKEGHVSTNCNERKENNPTANSAQQENKEQEQKAIANATQAMTGLAPLTGR